MRTTSLATSVNVNVYAKDANIEVRPNYATPIYLPEIESTAGKINAHGDRYPAHLQARVER